MQKETLFTVKAPKTIMEMTWEEVEMLAQTTDVAMVGVASIEEHGFHLPLGMDTFFCTEILKFAHDALEVDGFHALIGPIVEYGVCPGAMDYPGTITVRPDTLKALLVDICESLYQHGFKKIALVMGHDENLPAMGMAAQEMVLLHNDIKVLSLNIMFAMKASEGASLKSRKRDGHAGAGETARLMVSHPNLVYLDRVRPDPDIDAPPAREIIGGNSPLLGGGVYNPARELSIYQRDRHPGQTGDPTTANPEVGQKSLQAMGGWVADVIMRDFIGK